MSTRQLSFAIQGMFCVKCAVDLERTLAQLDGIVAAQVNYATERAAVVYDPTRIPPIILVNAIKSRGYEVPLIRITLYVDDLLYATSAQTIERVLGRTEGVAWVSVDFASRSVTLEMLPDPHHRGESARRADLERVLARLGFRPTPSPTTAAARMFVLRALIIMGLELLVITSAGAHAGLFGLAGLLHSPSIVMLLSMLMLLGVGLPFYILAYDAASQGVFDTSVVTALLAIVSAFASVPLAMVAPTSWLTDAGLVVAATVTAGWFLVRALQILGIQRSQGAATKDSSIAIVTTPAQRGVLSDGSRH